MDYENAVALVAAAVAEQQAELEEEEALDSSAETDKIAEELSKVIDLSDEPVKV